MAQVAGSPWSSERGESESLVRGGDVGVQGWLVVVMGIRSQGLAWCDFRTPRKRSKPGGEACSNLPFTRPRRLLVCGLEW